MLQSKIEVLKEKKVKFKSWYNGIRTIQLYEKTVLDTQKNEYKTFYVYDGLHHLPFKNLDQALKVYDKEV
jgi:hypothetical protein